MVISKYGFYIRLRIYNKPGFIVPAEPLRQSEPAHSTLADMVYVLRMAESIGMSVDDLHGQTLQTGMQIARRIRDDEVARVH